MSAAAPQRRPVGRETARGPLALHLTGAALLALLVAAQTALHTGERSPYLYLTYPGQPIDAGQQADGYVYWLEGHPTYAESWQFIRQAQLYAGGSADRDTGDTDARSAYPYLVGLLARPLGYYGAATALNAACWYAAVLAIWYAARHLLGRGLPAFAAALLAASGQGFVFMAGTPMSYVAGYAWAAVALALALRWRLFGWRSSWRRWALWGWIAGLGGIFYFTHLVVLGSAWLFGARRTPLRHLLLATAIALLVPLTWYPVARLGLGLEFRDATAEAMAGELRKLIDVAMRAPLLFPAEAGQGIVRALVGGFTLPLLALAALGIARAGARGIWR